MDNPAVVGGLINCALFLGGIIVAGAIDSNHWAVALALLSSATAVFCYTAQAFVGAPSVADAGRRRAVFGLHIVSNLLAAAAGVALLVGYFG